MADRGGVCGAGSQRVCELGEACGRHCKEVRRAEAYALCSGRMIHWLLN